MCAAYVTYVCSTYVAYVFEISATTPTYSTLQYHIRQIYVFCSDACTAHDHAPVGPN